MSAADVAMPQRVPYHTRAPAAVRRPQPKREPKEEEMDADDEFPDAKDSDFIKVRTLTTVLPAAAAPLEHAPPPLELLGASKRRLYALQNAANGLSSLRHCR